VVTGADALSDVHAMGGRPLAAMTSRPSRWSASARRHHLHSTLGAAVQPVL
jgi:thiamine monophosphate kinase